MSSKKKSQRNHARIRALQRFGIRYGNDMRNCLVRKIQSGDAIFLERNSLRCGNFAVNYQRQWYPVVYDNKRKEIVTFLPQNYLDRYQAALQERQAFQ